MDKSSVAPFAIGLIVVALLFGCWCACCGRKEEDSTKVSHLQRGLRKAKLGGVHRQQEHKPFAIDATTLMPKCSQPEENNRMNMSAAMNANLMGRPGNWLDLTHEKMTSADLQAEVQLRSLMLSGAEGAKEGEDQKMINRAIIKNRSDVAKAKELLSFTGVGGLNSPLTAHVFGQLHQAADE